MILLILTPILIGWFFATRWLARRATNRIVTPWKKTLAMWVLVPVLFLLPFADGVIGGLYLRHLCNDPEGGFVVVRPLDSVKRAKSERLPIARHGYSFYEVEELKEIFTDLDTQESFASYKLYQASKPIWFLQIFQFDGGRNGARCSDSIYEMNLATNKKLAQLIDEGKSK